MDTNSYLRLAQNAHPLLFEEFGEECFTLFPHDELEDEFKRSRRLKSKFDWFNEPKYVNNRTKKLVRTKSEKRNVDLAYEMMWALVVEENLGPSETDTFIVAVGAALEIRIVTDDSDMINLAETYGVHQISSMELMKMMLEAEHIDMERINRIVEQWIYDRDLPSKNFKKDFKCLFEVYPPTGNC